MPSPVIVPIIGSSSSSCSQYQSARALARASLSRVPWSSLVSRDHRPGASTYALTIGAAGIVCEVTLDERLQDFPNDVHSSPRGIVSEFVTLDGVIEAPGRTKSTETGRTLGPRS